MMSDIEHKIETKTEFNNDLIRVTSQYKCGKTINKIAENVVRLQDEGIRKALIELGWTPPRPTPGYKEPRIMSELKPCPFCGGEGKTQFHNLFNPARTKYQPLWLIECEKCFASTFNYFEYEREAIQAWNRRTS